MADRTEMRVAVSASAPQVMAVVSDVEAYPEWNPEMRSARVITRNTDRLPAQVAFDLDAGPLKGEYVLEYTWHASGSTWRLVQGPGLTALDGSYTVTAVGPAESEVTYSLNAELSLPVLAVFKRKAEQRLAERAVHGLKARVESRSQPPDAEVPGTDLQGVDWQDRPTESPTTGGNA